MNKTVLVPIDLGQIEQGKSLIKTAMKLVEPIGGNLILLNVLPDIPGYVTAQMPENLLINTKDNAIKDLEEIAKNSGVGDQAKMIVREGRIHNEILTVAEDTVADLIVMASHQPEFFDYLLGSTAARVVRHAKCSVLIARGP